MPWYLLNTKPRNEARACENVKNQGYQAFYPDYQNTRLKNGKRTSQKEALFPGYLFVNITDEKANFNALRSTRGVYDFVRFGGELAKVSDALVQQLQSNLASLQNAAAANSDANLKAGDAVAITNGPFNRLSAIYQKQDGLERSVLFVKLLEKQTKLTLKNTEFKKQSA